MTTPLRFLHPELISTGESLPVSHERRLLDDLRVALAAQHRARINYDHAARAIEEAGHERTAADAAVEQLQAAIRAHLSGAR